MNPLTFALTAQQLGALIEQRRTLIPADVIALGERIRPVGREAATGPLRYYQRTEPFKVFTSRALAELATGLVAIGTIHTLHRPASHSSRVLLPTCSEVFAHLPENLRQSVVACEVRSPVTEAEWASQRPAIQLGWHVGITTLYKT